MNRKSILMISLFLFGFFLSFNNSSNKNLKLNKDLPQIQLSFESSLNYGAYVALYMTLDEDDKIKWEFSGTNQYVGIIVRALSDSEFYKLQNLQSYYYYSLSDGSYYRSSGTFIIPSYDTWYFVFINADQDQQTTYLTYDIELIDSDNSNFDVLIGCIIGFIIFFGLIGVIAEVSSKSKKKRKEQALEQYIPVQISNQSIANDYSNESPKIQGKVKYCIKCGKSNVLEAIYCENCGTKFP